MLLRATPLYLWLVLMLISAGPALAHTERDLSENAFKTNLQAAATNSKVTPHDENHDSAVITSVFASKDPAIVFDGAKLYWLRAPKTLRRYHTVYFNILYPSTFTFTLTGTPLSYSSAAAPGPPSVGGLAPNEFTMLTSRIPIQPTGDDEQLDVGFYATDAKGTSKNPTDSQSLRIPVNINLFDPPTVTFSLGIVVSNLHDDNYVLAPSGTSSIIKSGLGGGGGLKGIALTHLVVAKYGDLSLGPCLGILSNGGYFLGASALRGKSSRFCVAIGWEWSKVSRLDTALYSPGQTVPNGTSINQNVFRQSRLEVALTYSFVTLK